MADRSAIPLALPTPRLSGLDDFSGIALGKAYGAFGWERPRLRDSS